MDKVQKYNSFNTNTPSSESYRNYLGGYCTPQDQRICLSANWSTTDPMWSAPRLFIGQFAAICLHGRELDWAGSGLSPVTTLVSQGKNFRVVWTKSCEIWGEQTALLSATSSKSSMKKAMTGYSSEPTATLRM